MMIHGIIPLWVIILIGGVSNFLTWLLTWLISAGINERYHEKHMPRSARDTIKDLRDDKARLEAENEELRAHLADRDEHLEEIRLAVNGRDMRPAAREIA